ncbi:hypothetical protein A2U01_0011594, partial [Trifolium medium]|nr:hypothetical protein [Trifolium medium]
IRDGNFKRFTTVAYPRLLSELFFQTKLVKVLRRFYPNLVKEERATKLDAGFLTRMSIKENVVKAKNPLKINYEEHLYCNGFPVISEADDEEVIQFFLQGIKQDTGVEVPRKMVPPAPTKEEKSEPKDVKKEASKKRKVEGVVIGETESRTKRKHEKITKKDSSETDSDDGKTLAEKLKQKSQAEASKASQKHPSKGKSSETIIDHSAEAHIDPNVGFSKSLTSILPELETVYVSSTSTTDTTELDKEADAFFQKGVAKIGEVPNFESIAKQLFVQEPTPDLKFLEKHYSPDPLNMQIFTHELPQPTQPQPETNQPIESTPQPENQDQMDIDAPNNVQPQIEPENPQPPQPLTMDDIVIPYEILH